MNINAHQTTVLYTGITRWLITLTVVLVAVVEVLDMTIVNVSLPNMMGGLGANSEQITWVLTSYIVAAAVCMPLTGFLVNRFGEKRLLLFNIAGFLITSILCGLSVNLTEIVFFRILQGVFGAGLVPLSQLILKDAFPPEERGKAMAIWGIGIMVAPALGPTIGAYITDLFNWRWVFFINIPVCIFSFFLARKLLIQTIPQKKSSIDWLGMFLMTTGISCLQIFLDRGNQEDWLQSRGMIILLLLWISALTIFITRGIKKPDNIINLRVFQDINFTICTVLLALYCIGMFGAIAAQPMLMVNYMGYPVSEAGLVMMPRGLTSALGMAVVAGLIKRYDPRPMIALGILLTALGTWMMSQFTLDASISYMAWSGAVQGFGMGLFFVPLSVVAFSTLPQNNTQAEAAGIFSFGRNLGSSIGISVFTTLLTRETQINWNRLGGHINIFNPNLQNWLQKHGWSLHDPIALQQLARQLANQAAMIAFIDVFWAAAILFLCMLPLVLLMKRRTQNV